MTFVEITDIEIKWHGHIKRMQIGLPKQTIAKKVKGKRLTFRLSHRWEDQVQIEIEKKRSKLDRCERTRDMNGQSY